MGEGTGGEGKSGRNEPGNERKRFGTELSIYLRPTHRSNFDRSRAHSTEIGHTRTNFSLQNMSFVILEDCETEYNRAVSE
jgi:hypothetical protein